MLSTWCELAWGTGLLALPWSVALAVGTDLRGPLGGVWRQLRGVDDEVGPADTDKVEWRALCPGCGYEHRQQQEPRLKDGWNCVWCGPDRGALTWSEAPVALPSPAERACRVAPQTPGACLPASGSAGRRLFRAHRRRCHRRVDGRRRSRVG
jgi:hypothetical protein